MNLIFGKRILGKLAMKFNKVRLLETQEEAYFLDGIKELYDVIEKDPLVEATRKVVPYRRIKSFLIRKFILMPWLFRLKLKRWDNKKINFAAMVSGDFSILMPYALFSKWNFVYMYDAWPRFHHWIFPMLEVLNVKYVFFSAKQAWQDHQRKFPHSECQSLWLPEGIDASAYSFKPYDQKNIDVLEFGRRYEAYHLLIKAPLAAQSKNHLYAKNPRQLLFSSKPDFVEALAASKIVICVPSSITHPQRAEYISSMTLRYLQAMASKCLIVGVTPIDMGELFDYPPIVEIDMDKAAEQLLAILENYDAYLPLIEKNYIQVVQHHQWQHRFTVIKQKIAAQL